MNQNSLGSGILALAALALTTGSSCAEIFYVAGKNPGASDEKAGTEQEPWKTVSKAAAALQPGDTVIIDSGTYRERVSPARGGESAEKPITYRAKDGAEVIIKGSDVWKPSWSTSGESGSLHAAPIEESLFSEFEVDEEPALITHSSPFKARISISNGQDKMTKPTTGLAISLVARPAEGPDFLPVLGQIFADGVPLVQVTSRTELEGTPQSWMAGPDGEEILLNWGPREKPLGEVEFEITTRAKIFAPKTRGMGHIHVDGITFEHAANQGPFPQVGAVSVRSGHHWVIRNCTIRLTQTLGLDVGREFFSDRLRDGNPESTGHIIENNLIADNGLCGIAGFECSDVRIAGNRIEGNNRLGFIQGLNASWEEYAGIKILHSQRVEIADNFVVRNFAFGIWFDNQWQGSRITRNLVLGNQMAGIFIEFGQAPDAPLLVDNNIVAFTEGGHGIYTHDASDVIIANNLSYRNSDWGIWQWTISPRGEPGGCSNNRVLNNIVFGNGAGSISLPMPGPLNENNKSDYNAVNGYVSFTGMTPPEFQFSLSLGKHPSKKSALISRILNVYETNDVPQFKRMDAEFLKKTPVSFDLDMWRLVSGNDKHSTTSSFGKSVLRTGIPDFECVWREDFKAACPPVEGITEDYFGNPITEGKVYPGPFQVPSVDPATTAEFETYARNDAGDLIITTKEQKGRNRFVLWPKAINLTTKSNVTERE